MVFDARRFGIASAIDATLLLPYGAAVAAADEPAYGGFIVETNAYLIGQAPDWLDATHVVWQDPLTRDEDGDGTFQIYSSTLEGADKVCLTCGLPGPNQVPVVQPNGEWIIFHSWATLSASARPASGAWVPTSGS